MKKGLFSFAVALFAILVLFYFTSAAFSLSDYQSAGQKRLELQVLSQGYSNTIQYFDDAILNLIVNSGYNSNESGTCAGSSSTFPAAVAANAGIYVADAVTNLSGTLNNAQWLSVGYTAASLNVTSMGSLNITSPCVNGTMHWYQVNASFPINFTSSNHITGYINKAFSENYNVYSARNSSNYYILVQRAGVQLRCVVVTGCT